MINKDDIPLKFKFRIKEVKLGYDIVEATNEKEAKEILEKRFCSSDYHYEKVGISTISCGELLDREILLESFCGNCDSKILFKVSEEKFKEQKAGQVICPKCSKTVHPCDDCLGVVYPCEDCSDHNQCDNCPYKFSLLGTIVAVDDEPYNSEEDILDKECKEKNILELVKDGCEIKFGKDELYNNFRENKLRNKLSFCQRCYDLLFSKCEKANYCNDKEDNYYRYAASYTLKSGVRIYAEWLISSEFVNESDVEEEFLLNKSIFNLNSLDYFSLDYQYENE